MKIQRQQKKKLSHENDDKKTVVGFQNHEDERILLYEGLNVEIKCEIQDISDMEITDEAMKKYNVKNAFLGILAILTYFILPMLEGVPFELAGVDTATLPLVAKIIYMIAYETVLMAIVVLIFHKKLEKDWQDMKQNHMN